MPTFNIYQPVIAEKRISRRWLIWALTASIFFHIGLFVFFRNTKLEHFEAPTLRLVPRNFSLGRANIDSKLLDSEPEKPAAESKSPQQAMADIQIPDDKPSAQPAPDDVVYKPTAPESVKAIVNDKPKVDDTNLQALTQAQQNTSKDLDTEMNSVREQLLKDKPKVNSKSLLKLAETTHSNGGGANAGNDSGIPGTKSLNDALAGTGGGLHNGDRIGIKGGALFEYDKADIRPNAAEALKNLATIVKRYPSAIFTIDGYADSFGSAAYNLDLSQRRADAVKAWLLMNAGVNAFKIEAYGHGSTNFVVPPTGTVEEQENNRRVEIGIKFPR